MILIFSVFKKVSFSILIANKSFRVTVLLLLYFYDQFMPALKKSLRQLMIYSTPESRGQAPDPQNCS